MSHESLQNVPRGLELPDIKTTFDHFFHRPDFLLQIIHIFTFANESIELGHNLFESGLIHGLRIIEVDCGCRISLPVK